MDHIKDRATEWVAEWHPHLEGAEFDAKVQEASEELEAIDASADQDLI